MINLSAVRSRHRKFLSAHDAAVRAELDQALDAGLDHVRTRPGFKPQTGGLQRATTGQIVRTARGSIVRLQNRHPAARPIDKGSRAHVIQARSAKTLRFASGDGFIFRRRVNHPGNRPYHFLRTATAAAAHNFELGMTARLRTLSRQF